MDEFWIADNDSFLHALKHMNPIQKKIAFELSCKGMFDHWFMKVKTISKVKDKQKHIRHLMFKKLISKDIDETYMTISDSLYYLVQWCSFHKKDITLLTEHVKIILEGNHTNNTVKTKQNF